MSNSICVTIAHLNPYTEDFSIEFDTMSPVLVCFIVHIRETHVGIYKLGS